MKKIFSLNAGIFVLLTIAAMMMASCVKTGDENSAPGDASLRIVLDEQALSRATGATFPTNDNVINRIAVGVFNANGTVNAIDEQTVSGATSAEITCTPGTCDVVVVANAPANLFDGVTTKAAFLAKTVSLTQTAVSGVQTSTNLPMSGETTAVSLVAGQTATPTVSLSRLVARISLSEIKVEFGAPYQDATFSVEGVFLYNALAVSRVAVGNAIATMPATPQYLHGGTVVSDVWTPQTNYLYTVASLNLNTGQSSSTPFWFYTFANNDTSNATRLVIKGTFDPATGDSNGPRTTYYVVTVNKAQTGTAITGGSDGERGTSTVARNTEYKIRVTLKKEGVADPGVAEPDPDDNPAIEVTLNIDPWTSVEQDVEMSK